MQHQSAQAFPCCLPGGICSVLGFSEIVLRSTTLVFQVFLVTELCKRGELLNVVKNKKYFSEDEAREYFGQLVDGVKYLHSHTIIHRDLKVGFSTWAKLFWK